ncbi:MAG TPA: hypothetical protein VFM69_06815, partial [Pricia sp.]|nr:hypothetical protein [Pricia sp.]
VWPGMVLVFTILFLGGIGTVQAQDFQRGDLMLGTDLGSGLVNSASNGLFGLNIGLNEGAGFNVGISPKVGYFLNENFMLGAAINLGFSESPESGGESVNTFVYGLQGLTRFYINPADVEAEELAGRSRFFLENNAGVAGINVKDGQSTFGFAFGFGPGMGYFITDNVALEATVKYNGLLGDDTIDYQNSIGINLGVQIFLDGANSVEGVIEGQE